MTDTSLHHLSTVNNARTAARGRWTVLAGVAVLVTLSLAGAVVSVRSGLAEGYGEALGPTGRLSIPWPMMCAQVLAGLAAASSRRWVAVVGAGFVALATTLGVVSGFFDGGYAEDLTVAERALQVTLIAALAVVAAVAVRRLTAVLRR